MRHYILTTLALASVVIGCTKSSFVDVPEVQKTPITFETYTGKTPTTKATEITTDTLANRKTSNNPAFHVKAFYAGEKYMDEIVWSTCTLDGNKAISGDQSWDYDGTVYWPATGSLDFYAFGVSDNLEQDSETSYSYTVRSAVTNPAKTQGVKTQDDLIVAIPKTQSGTSNSTVSLNFKHLLSRVGFTLMTTNNESAVEVRIKKLDLIGDFYSAGTVDITAETPSITPTGSAARTTYSLLSNSYTATNPSAGEYYIFQQTTVVPPTGVAIYPNAKLTVSSSEGVGDAYASVKTSPNDRYMMLIPGTMPSKVDIIYQLPGTSDQHVEIDLTSTANQAKLNFDEFEAGKAYEFVIKVSTDKIDFTGDVEDWDPVNGADTPIPQPTPDPTPDPAE